MTSVPCRDDVARLAHAVVLEVWGEEPCGVVSDAVAAVVQPKMRKRLMAALAQIDRGAIEPAICRWCDYPHPEDTLCRWLEPSD